jgi:hypothetical protein
MGPTCLHKITRGATEKKKDALVSWSTFNNTFQILLVYHHASQT